MVAWIVYGFGVWCGVGVVVAMLIGRVIRRRDERVPQRGAYTVMGPAGRAAAR